MRIATFDFIPFKQGMFDRNKPPAIFLFKHVVSGIHYVSRYVDASRFKDHNQYPLSLVNKLKKMPSEVEIYALPLTSRIRTINERTMNNVVDALIDAGLYRKSNTHGTPKNVLEKGQDFRVISIRNKNTGAIFFGLGYDETDLEQYLRTKLLYLRSLSRSAGDLDQVVVAYFKGAPPIDFLDWEVESLGTMTFRTDAIRLITERSMHAMAHGLIVLNRIRTRSPAHIYTETFRLPKITAEKYVQDGLAGVLKKSSKLRA